MLLDFMRVPWYTVYIVKEIDMSKIIFLSHNATNHTLIFAVGSARYEYHLPDTRDTIALYLIRRVSIGKGFAYAKRWGKLMEHIS